MKTSAALAVFLTAALGVSTAVQAMDAVTSATPKAEGTPAKKETAVPVKETDRKPAKPAVKKNKKKQPPKKAKKIEKKRQKEKRTPAPESVNISAYQPDTKDATKALKQAIRSRARKIVFDKAGIYHLQPVNLPGKTQIILNEGVEIKAIAPEKADKNLPGLFNIIRISRLTITGKGKNTITALPGMPVFNMFSSNNIELRNLTLQNGTSAIKIDNCYSVRVYNFALDNFSTSGLDITGGGWNSFYDTQFRNISGCGAIVTPAIKGELPNITFDNCEFFNSGSGFALRRPEKVVPVVKAPDKKPRPARFDIRSCRFFNNSGIDMELNGNIFNGNIRIENCVFTNGKTAALKLVDFSANPEMAILAINNTAFRPGDFNMQTPILFTSTLDAPAGNVKFSKSSVSSPVHKKAITFDVKKNAGSLEGILPVFAADGNRINAILNVEKK